MEPYLYWILIAIALVVVELLSGTFYLLILGIAACAGGILAWAGLSFPVQAIAVTALAVLGVAAVHRFHVRTRTAGSGGNAIDIGQRVTLDSWINESAGLARVSYRGTLWDAQVIGEHGTGTGYYIRGVDGSTLRIVTAQP